MILACYWLMHVCVVVVVVVVVVAVAAAAVVVVVDVVAVVVVVVVVFLSRGMRNDKIRLDQHMQSMRRCCVKTC